MSENQNMTKLMTSPITRNVAAVLGPPTIAPIATSNPVSVASRIVVRIPAFQFDCVT